MGSFQEAARRAVLRMRPAKGERLRGKALSFKSSLMSIENMYVLLLSTAKVLDPSKLCPWEAARPINREVSRDGLVS